MAALAVAPGVLGHTWIEQMRNINDKGEYVGEYGYPRGMVSKTDPGFDGNSMNWELPGANGKGKVFITADTPLCHPSQRKQQQSSDKYPRLQATPGGFIAMRYMENGHVTLPNNQKGKPKKGGTIFVYGTTEPKEDETIADVLQWTEDGKGGNKGGKLITMNDFDDGRCYEKNGTPINEERAKTNPNYAMGQAVDGAPGNYPLFCETNVKLPEAAELGKPYTFYWVWQWTTAPDVDPGLPNGKDEYYTTCIDVDVADSKDAMAKAESKFALGQQDAMKIAVADYASRTALMTNALQGEVGPVFSSMSTGAPSATGGAPSATSGAPAPTGGAPSPTSKLPSIPSGSPYLNSTMSTITDIPTLTGRPGDGPTSLPTDSGVVTVTDTIIVTVTAPAAPAVTPPATYSARHKYGAKFRGRFA